MWSLTRVAPGAAHETSRKPWARYARPGVFVLVAAVSLYMVLPSLLAVFASWRSLRDLVWYWAALALLSAIGSFVLLWELDRIALDEKSWFVVACSQLSGNAVGRILPGGGATATAFSVGMLRRAGIDSGRETTALAASTSLQVGTRLALPVLALPAIVAGAPVDRGLATAAYLGAAVLLLLVVAGVLAFAFDRPVEAAGRAAQWVLNGTLRRRRKLADLPGRLLAQRDFVRATIGRRWKAAVFSAAGSTAFDLLALLCARRAPALARRPRLCGCEPAHSHPADARRTGLRRGRARRDTRAGGRLARRRAPRHAHLSARLVLAADSGGRRRLRRLPPPLSLSTREFSARGQRPLRFERSGPEPHSKCKSHEPRRFIDGLDSGKCGEGDGQGDQPGALGTRDQRRSLARLRRRHHRLARHQPAGADHRLRRLRRDQRCRRAQRGTQRAREAGSRLARPLEPREHRRRRALLREDGPLRAGAPLHDRRVRPRDRRPHPARTDRGLRARAWTRGARRRDRRQAPLRTGHQARGSARQDSGGPVTHRGGASSARRRPVPPKREELNVNGNVTLGRFGGVEVRLNWSWLVILALLVWTLSDGVFPAQDPGLSHGTYLVMGVAAAVLFLVSVLLHELGHAWTARREGVEIDGITLWLFGGVTQFKSRFVSAGAEFRIAI